MREKGGEGTNGSVKGKLSLSVAGGLSRAPWLTDVCVLVTYQPGLAVEGVWGGGGERDSTAGTVSHFSSCHLIHD